MIDIVKKWLGELLIRFGQELLRSSREAEFYKIRKQVPTNKYYW